MSTAPAQSNFPRPPGPDGAGSGADHPARRARQVAAIAAAGTVAALTGFFAVRAAQADDTSGATTAAAGDEAGSGATPSASGETPTSPGGGGYDRGFDIDGDGDRPAPPDGGFGRGGSSGAPGQFSPGQPSDGSSAAQGQPGSGAAPALPGGGADSSSGGS